MEEHSQVEVTYKYYLPDNQTDLELHQNAYKYFSTLHDIYDECRRKYKYDDDASEETIEFAEKIASLVNESGALDVP